MKAARSRAMDLFSAYCEMADEDQAHALAILRTLDPAVHDALVQLLVADALAHTLDSRPWLRQACAAPGADGLPDRHIDPRNPRSADSGCGPRAAVAAATPRPSAP